MNPQRKVTLKNIDETLTLEEGEAKFIDFIDAENLAEFNKEISEAINSIAAKYGVSLQQIDSNKTAFDINLSASIGPVRSIKMDVAARNYMTYGHQLNLKPEWFYVPLCARVSGEMFEMRITGLTSIKDNFVVRFETNKGQRFLQPHKVVQMMVDVNRKEAYSSLAMQMLKASMQKVELGKKLYGPESQKSIIGSDQFDAAKALTNNSKKIVALPK